MVGGFDNVVPPMSDAFRHSKALSGGTVHRITSFLVGGKISKLFCLNANNRFDRVGATRHVTLTRRTMAVISKQIPMLVNINSPSASRTIGLTRRTRTCNTSNVITVGPCC